MCQCHNLSVGRWHTIRHCFHGRHKMEILLAILIWVHIYLMRSIEWQEAQDLFTSVRNWDKQISTQTYGRPYIPNIATGMELEEHYVGHSAGFYEIRDTCLFKWVFSPLCKIMEHKDQHFLRLFLLEYQRHKIKMPGMPIQPQQFIFNHVTPSQATTQIK